MNVQWDTIGLELCGDSARYETLPVICDLAQKKISSL